MAPENPSTISQKPSKVVGQRILVIVPTYNEVENIQNIIPEILQCQPHVDILVVDDESPDGTARAVKTLQESWSQVKLLSRQKKEGLGKAYLAGFKWGLDAGYDVLVEMDADFSHRPVDLQRNLEALTDGVHAVVGSRWVPGGGTVNWGLGRQWISKGGSFYSRFILGYPIRDWTGGFNVWTKEVLNSIELDTIKSEGYSFQIELKYRALKKGFKVIESPIIFEERRLGESKMSAHIVFEALYRVWCFRWTQ